MMGRFTPNNKKGKNSLVFEVREFEYILGGGVNAELPAEVAPVVPSVLQQNTQQVRGASVFWDRIH